LDTSQDPNPDPQRQDITEKGPTLPASPPFTFTKTQAKLCRERKERKKERNKEINKERKK
jgi:hypothetical protein